MPRGRWREGGKELQNEGKEKRHNCITGKEEKWRDEKGGTSQTINETGRGGRK